MTTADSLALLHSQATTETLVESFLRLKVLALAGDTDSALSVLHVEKALRARGLSRGQVHDLSTTARGLATDFSDT